MPLAGIKPPMLGVAVAAQSMHVVTSTTPFSRKVMQDASKPPTPAHHFALALRHHLRDVSGQGRLHDLQRGRALSEVVAAGATAAGQGARQPRESGAPPAGAPRRGAARLARLERLLVKQPRSRELVLHLWPC